MVYRILLIHDVEHQTPRGVIRWAYAHRTAALQAYSPPDMQVDRVSHDDVNLRACRGYDLVMLLDYMLAQNFKHQLSKARYPGLFVVSFNKDSRSREHEYRECLKHADWVIVNNRERYRAGGIQPRTCNITNPIDTRFWAVQQPIESREPLAIWTGGTGLKKQKGYAEILKPLRPHLHKLSIELELRPVTAIVPEQVKTPEEMLAWYNRASYVLCASATEGGGPNFLMEAAACGCVPITTSVGSVPEFARADNAVVVERTIPAFIEGVQRARERRCELARAASETVRESWGYDSVGGYFYALWRALITRGVRGVRPFSFRDCEPGEI